MFLQPFSVHAEQSHPRKRLHTEVIPPRTTRVEQSPNSPLIVMMKAARRVTPVPKACNMKVDLVCFKNCAGRFSRSHLLQYQISSRYMYQRVDIPVVYDWYEEEEGGQEEGDEE